jgi:hypothetical protein
MRSVEIDALQSMVNLDRLVCFGHLWPRSRLVPPIVAFAEKNIYPVERCFDTARRRHFKIVLPEGEDPRVLAAARGLIEREIAHPIVLERRTRSSKRQTPPALRSTESKPPIRETIRARRPMALPARRGAKA